MGHEPHDLPPDLHDVARALREHRPRMSGDELARARERAHAGRSRTARTARGGWMRSRIAITALLAGGALMSSGGAALGISALSTTTDAGQAQYGPVQPTPAPVSPSGQDTLAGPVRPRSAPVDPSGDADRGGVLADQSEGGGEPTAAVQPARQLQAADDGDGELPVTGYAAIPLLLGGLGLLVAGLVLRRGTGTAPIT